MSNEKRTQVNVNSILKAYQDRVAKLEGDLVMMTAQRNEAHEKIDYLEKRLDAIGDVDNQAGPDNKPGVPPIVKPEGSEDGSATP